MNHMTMALYKLNVAHVVSIQTLLAPLEFFLMFYIIYYIYTMHV